MDNFRYIDLIGGGILSAIGYLINTILRNQERHGKDMNEFKIKVAEEYIHNTRFDSALREIADDIKYIRDKLDHK